MQGLPTSSGLMSDVPTLLSEDDFLGGKLRLKQPRRGHRAGHDAVLLAAATPARPGDCVVDLGAGVGTAGLAIAARIHGVDLVLVERDDTLADIARSNLAANKLDGRAIALDVTASAVAFAAAGLPPDSADRVLMNPPFNDPSRHQASPDAARRSAHEEDDDTLAAWMRTVRRILKPAGTISLIWRAEGLARVLVALEAGFGDVRVLPVYPRPEAPAIRVLVRATKSSRAGASLMPGIFLNDAAGGVPDDVQAVLNGAAVLPLATT
jgi:tRNA1(Val) A37 N6-methylase TrmN6